jgi:lipid-A-disaccharide synthase
METSNSKKYRLMIVAGEASGDMHAAGLVQSLQELSSDTEFEFFGCTGQKMRAVGVESIVQADDLAIIGLLDEALALPKFWRAFKSLRDEAIRRSPHAVILVDWPDFNLRLARALHRRGLKVIYYVSPQLWAWRSYRIRNISRDVDLLLSILPFEPAWYKERGVTHVEFVGHPLVGEVSPRYGREEFCRRHQLDYTRPIITLLPGSRSTEIKRILPTMLETLQLISTERPDVQTIIALAPNRTIEEVASIAASIESEKLLESSNLRIVRHETREALAAADAAAVASGTATLEAALIGTPMVIVYKISRFARHTLARLINVEHYGLVNLIAGERVSTELMQDAFTGGSLADELISLLDKETNIKARNRLREVSSKLGEGRALERAAAAILNALPSWHGDSI